MPDVGTVLISAAAGAAAGTGGGIVKDRFLTKYKRRLDDRAELRKLQSRYKGRILEAALDWDRRMTQIYEGAYQWLDPPDKQRADPDQYYFQSVVFRFLQLTAIARRFEAEAMYIDSTVAKRRDFDLLRYAKAFLWVMIHAELTPDDGQPGRDHLRSDAFRPMLDLCYSTSPAAAALLPETRSNDDELIFDLERYLAMLKLAEQKTDDMSDRERTYKGYVNELLALFDGVRPDDYEPNGRQRRRWDRLVGLHLLTLAFIDAFHYDSDGGELAARTETAVAMLLYPETLQREFNVWLPRLGLGRAPDIDRVRAVLASVVMERGERLESGEDRAKRVYDAILGIRKRRRLPDGPDLRPRPRTTWAESDYDPIGDRLKEAAAKAVDRVGVGPDDRVLDLACGTGNAAVLAAKRQARTVAVDFEPRMLERARQRHSQEDLVDWRLGDVTDLPLAGDKFTVVLSVFGVIYAQDEHAVAQQLAKCCDHRTRIAITAWTPGSFMPEMGRVLAPFVSPASDGAFPSARWGDEEALTNLLSQHGVALVEAGREQVVLDFPNLDVATECLLNTAGHVLCERSRLEREGRWGVLRDQFRAFIAEHDEGDEDQVRLSLEYLLAVAEYTGLPTAEGSDVTDE